jgi:hypothetical protein
MAVLEMTDVWTFEHDDDEGWNVACMIRCVYSGLSCAGGHMLGPRLRFLWAFIAVRRCGGMLIFACCLTDCIWEERCWFLALKQKWERGCVTNKTCYEIPCNHPQSNKPTFVQ